MTPPIGNMNAHQSLEHATMVSNSEVQQFVHDDKVLEASVLIGEINCERDNSRLRA
jgi:hypothetical protein